MHSEHIVRSFKNEEPNNILAAGVIVFAGAVVGFIVWSVVLLGN
jgi:hypothetical protein